MKMRTFIGLCAALAFAAGSTAVHAVKIVAICGDDLDALATDDTPPVSVTYAKEMLTSNGSEHHGCERRGRHDDVLPTLHETMILFVGAPVRHYGQSWGRPTFRLQRWRAWCFRTALADRHFQVQRLRPMDFKLQLRAGSLETRWRCSGWTAMRSIDSATR